LSSIFSIYLYTLNKKINFMTLLIIALVVSGIVAAVILNSRKNSHQESPSVAAPASDPNVSTTPVVEEVQPVSESLATAEEIAALNEAKVELKKKKPAAKAPVTKAPAVKTLSAKKPVKKAK
jgi:hypothetical protein